MKNLLIALALAQLNNTQSLPQTEFLGQQEQDFFDVQINGQAVQVQNVNGQAFLGDINLGNTHEIQQEAYAIKNNAQIWPDNKVYYVFRSGIPSSVKADFEYAAKEYKDKTNIDVIPRTNQKDYIEVISGGGCWSYVGRIGGKQQLNLATNCGKKAAIHEIGHAIGFWHEQTRSDRDQYITVHWDNIISSWHSQYKIVDGQRLVGDYDYYSIMHYFDTAASVGGGKKTFTVKDKSIDANKIGRVSALSQGDIEATNTLYKDDNVSDPDTPTDTDTDNDGSKCDGAQEWKVTGSYKDYDVVKYKNDHYWQYQNQFHKLDCGLSDFDKCSAIYNWHPAINYQNGSKAQYNGKFYIKQASGWQLYSECK